eukprot:8975-Heterococcus_DN1.PRE.2
MIVSQPRLLRCKDGSKKLTKQQRKPYLFDSSSRSSTDTSMPEAKAATVKHTLRQQDRLPFGKQQSTSNFEILIEHYTLARVIAINTRDRNKNTMAAL